MVQRDKGTWGYKYIRVGKDDVMTHQFFDAQVYPSASIINIAHACVAALGPVDIMTLDAGALQAAFKQAYEASNGGASIPAPSPTPKRSPRQSASNLSQTQHESRSAATPRRTPDPATDEQLRSILDA